MWDLERLTRRCWTKEVRKREKTIIRENTIEWLLKQLLGDNSINYTDWCNNTILNDYRFEELRPDDIVLDIGAGAGLYSILASLVVKRVYGMEPIVDSIYETNTSKRKNIEYLHYAFGKDGEMTECKFWNKNVFVCSVDLSHILRENDKITVIKCDCEGAEWEGFAICNDFKNVRMIDLEYHLKFSKKPLQDLIARLRKNGFDVDRKGAGKIGMIYGKR